MRNTPFIIDFTSSCVDCAERLVTIALVNATKVYCIADLYTLMECHAKNTACSELFRALLSQPVASGEWRQSIHVQQPTLASRQNRTRCDVIFFSAVYPIPVNY
jgi:hypothetical protein